MASKSSSKGGLKFDDTTLKRNLADVSDRVDTYIAASVSYSSDRTVAYAKETAPWRDRTGNARSGLRAEIEWIPKVSHSIYLFHTMSYGIWLEIRWAGKYAVILPTLKVQGPATMVLLSGLFSRLKAGGLL